MAKPSPKRSGVLFVVIFGALPLLVGCFAGYTAGRMAVNAIRARDWGETPAHILAVSLKTNSDGDGTTYQVICTYTYSWAGRPYEGKKVGFSSGSDNIGSWHQDTYDRLKAAFDRGQPVPCYVNPSRPIEAVLDRQVRLWDLAFLLVFTSVFGSVGACWLGTWVIGGRELGRAEAVVPQTSGAADPWLKNPAWASGVIRPGTGVKAAFALIFAVWWNVSWMPLLIFLPAEVLGKGDRLALLSLAGPLVGWIAILVAARAVIRNRKYGRSYLQLRTLPGVVGGHLAGDLMLQGQFLGMETLKATLKCVNKINRKGNDHTNIETLWEDTRTLEPPPAVFGQPELRIPIDFQIPGSCRPYDESDRQNTVTWRLDVKAATEGVDLALSFDVPVFLTEASDPTLGESPEKVEAERELVASDASPAPRKIRVLTEPSGETTFANSAMPGFGFFTTFLVVGCIFTAATVFFAVGVYRHNWFLLIFLAGFGFFSPIIWLLLLSCFGSHRVTFESDALRTQRRWGPLHWGRVVACAEIEEVSYKQSASSGTRKWYRVYAQVSGGRKVTLAGMVPGEAAAKWYVRQVQQRTTARQQSSAAVG